MSKKVKIAAVGDLHVGEINTPKYQTLFEEISQKADIFVICGDLTQRGSLTDIHLFVEQLKSCTIPVVMVLGNHEFERGKQKEIRAILKENRVNILQGEAIVIHDIAFAGVKGFGGGFGDKLVAPFGEEIMKAFAQESVNEALALERALTSVQSIEKKIAVLHYSPIRATVIGEHTDIIPFLGSSRLEDPIDRYHVDMVFHGHAHHGVHEGKTVQNIPVFNVAYDIMTTLHKDHPYKLIEI